MKLCKECNTSPIYIKKRELCKACYGRLQRAGENFSPIGDSVYGQNKLKNKREIEFIKNYFDHKNWIHHPAAFHIENETYSPDFYDGETNIFIEVSGTRQAYHYNKQKYALFHKTFPLIKFETRTPDGELLKEENGKLVWLKKPEQELF